MGVYIKGMEMPMNCGECLLAKLSPTGESLICNYMLSRVSWEERPFDCPLVPAPAHGRLIDADALDSSETDYLGNHLVYLVDIDDAPTIIPAEPFNNLSKPCKDDEDIPICKIASPASLGIYKKAEEGE